MKLSNLSLKTETVIVVIPEIGRVKMVTELDKFGEVVTMFHGKRFSDGQEFEAYTLKWCLEVLGVKVEEEQ